MELMKQRQLIVAVFLYFCDLKTYTMKKSLLAAILIVASIFCEAQTQHMKFLGIDLNCTISTFTSKLKGKGFVQDVNNSHENFVLAKGVFAGEKTKLEVRCAAKTHLISSVHVCFNMSTSYTYEDLQNRLKDKYGEVFSTNKGLKEEDVYGIKYVTDYTKWEVNKDEETGAYNIIILAKCSYRSTSPLIIAYIDSRNSQIVIQEVNSDF